VSALWRGEPAAGPRLRPITVQHLDAVIAIEQTAYAFPWTRGNFIDALAAGYDVQRLELEGEMVGYFVVMAGVEELHLLNLTVAPAWQRQGHARHMLEAIVRLARRARARQVWLEVRGSNERARTVYRRFGFTDIGLRKGYYPAPRGTREDAIVMGLAVDASAPEADDGLE
jgi:[ribosomal protein S18]-alanine N-acetyltransferase